KLRVEPGELTTLREDLHRRLREMDEAADLDALRRQAGQAEAAYRQSAAQLSAARRKAAKDLGKRVSEAMQQLAMQGGKFEAQLLESAPSAGGLETVEFAVAGHAGTTPRALAKVASGGELARISLALSVIASRAARVPTLIFD